MSLLVECPSCGKKLKVPDNLVGRQVRCADCANAFVAEAPAPAPPPSRRSRNDEDDEEERDRPSRRRSGRRDPGGNYAPHRGNMVMMLGIIGLVIILFEIVGYLVLPPGRLPPSVVGLHLRIMALGTRG